MTDTSGEQQLSFDHFELQKPLRGAIDKLGFEFCTPIQAQSLVHARAGHDVTGKAQTGTGKTAAFLITIINDLLSNPIEENGIWLNQERLSWLRPASWRYRLRAMPPS